MKTWKLLRQWETIGGVCDEKLPSHGPWSDNRVGCLVYIVRSAVRHFVPSSQLRPTFTSFSF